MTLPALAFTFLLAAAAVVMAGTMLSRAADVIAARTHLSGLWVGSSLLALATSLPEITTDVAAVRLGVPDLAAGDLFGSSMANMLILAIISLLPAGTDVFRKAVLDHALYAALAITLTCVAAVTILVRPSVSVLGVGPGSMVLLVTYLVGARAIFRHSALAREAVAEMEMSAAPVPVTDAGAAPASPSLRRSILTFAGAAFVILVAAPLFARSAAELADVVGIGTTFMGTWLVGFSTSLPELVTSLAAARLRAYDLAVGNLFGSNALNMSVFVVLDVVHRNGPLLSVVSPTHVLSALVAVALMSTATAALVYRAKGKVALLEPSSALIVIGYVLGLALIFLQEQQSILEHHA